MPRRGRARVVHTLFVQSATSLRHKSTWNRRTFLLLLLAFVRIAALATDLLGDPSCPCLENLDEYPISAEEQQRVEDDLKVNPSTYGARCEAHDAPTPYCTTEFRCNDIFPQRFSCDRSWCDRSWCWVDPTNCKLLNRRSEYLPQSGRYFSYSTCGAMDYFTRDNRVASLENQILKVGL
jgi:hypothetical protein